MQPSQDFLFKAGIPMTYYNCHNPQGLPIDGVDDGPDAFNKSFCTWEMVTGQSGTYLRTIDIQHDLLDWAHYPNYDPSAFINHWFYDNEIPECYDCGSKGTAKHPNGWSMCSSRMNQIVRVKVDQS